MKQIERVNKKRQKLTTISCVILIFVIFSFLGLITSYKDYDKFKPTSLITKEVTITDILVDDATNYISIEIDEDIYYIADTYLTNADRERLLNYQNEDAVIIYSSQDSTKYIYAITINNLTLDYTNSYLAAAKYNFIVSIVLVTILTIIFLIIFICRCKMKKTEKVDYVNTILTSQDIFTIIPFFKGSKILKLKKITKLLISIMTVVSTIYILALVLALVMFNFNNYGIVIGFIIVGLIIIISFILIILIPHFITRNKNIYHNEYTSYLETTSDPILKVNFLKAGLCVKSDKKDIYFDYRELNLYTTVCYRKWLNEYMIVICSAFDNNNDVTDFIIPLSNNIYKEIKENNIYIKGFDEVINNINTLADNKFKQTKKLFKIVVEKYESIQKSK